MVAKINKLLNWHVALILLVIGFAVFFTGLTNAFAGDDTAQIVDSTPVHSIANLPLFFEGGTFYVGKGLSPLYGVYYRPLMTTVYSLIYTLFGPHPIYFHIVQFLLCIGSSFVLYLIFKMSFGKSVALFLALIFLVHPISSQVAFAVPALQDALYFFFGITGLYVLISYKSLQSMILVALCLFLSLLSKEAGAYFVIMSLVYLFWWDKKRLLRFIAIIAIPVGLWLALRVNAVGLLGHNPHNSPIDNLSLSGRLMTSPSIVLFYITKFIFPFHLASQYHWIHPTFSVRYVLLPIIIDVAAFAILVLGAFRVHRTADKPAFYLYIFFGIWLILGLLFTLQIFPMDMTACENWFYFPMAGALGLLGVVATSLQLPFRFNSNYLTMTMILLIAVLGVRTPLRGLDWHNIYTISNSDIKYSANDFNAYNVIAADYFFKGDFEGGVPYAQKSVDMFPQGTNLNTLGLLYNNLKEYDKARPIFLEAIRYQPTPDIYDSVALAMLYAGDPSANIAFLKKAVAIYPQDAILWQWLAVIEHQSGDNASARQDITQAKKLSNSPTVVQAYTLIFNNQKITLAPN